jgi:hypothetical protein
MRFFIRLIKGGFVVAGALIIALVSISFIYKDRVAGILLSAVNRELSTKIEIGRYNLSLLRKFPRASVELQDVSVLSSVGYNRKEFKNEETDTLLKVKSVFLEFAMTDILRGNYKIGRITLADGKLNLLSDSSGRVNYEVTKPSESASASEGNMVINLDRITISGINVRYINRATSLGINGLVRSGRLKSRIAGNDFDLNCTSAFLIRSFEIFSSPVKVNAEGSLDLSLHQSDSGTVFRKGDLKLESFRFGLTGSVSSSDNADLLITGRNIDLGRIKKYLPEEYAAKLAGYSPEGIVKTECRISGKISRKENPGIDLSVSLSKGRIGYKDSDTELRDLQFSGSFTNGALHRPETFILKADSYRFRIGSAEWKGSFSLADFTHPSVKALFSGDIIPEELMSFLPEPVLKSAKGSLRLNLTFNGSLQKKAKYGISDLLDLDPHADISFRSLSFQGREKGLKIDDVTGSIMLAKNLWADELSFTWLGQRFRINGEFRNFPEWLAGKPSVLQMSGDVAAEDMNAALFLPDSTETKNGKASALILPGDIRADVSFRLRNFRWDRFEAGEIAGTVRYSPGRVELGGLKISALDGTTEGSCYLVQNRTRGFLSHGDFTFGNIDIKKAFNSFRNFGQDFIVAANLAGSLSGNLSLLMPLDSMLNPESKGLTAEGKYVLVNGALTSFEPVKALSDYIELSELENITFSKLENELFIRDRYVAIPQMEIKSSAADFTVSGKHGFDDSYEYHVKTYLSLLLSKKARKTSLQPEEFGAVEDDGLGRTSLFLKITGIDENIKVAYDLKAAGNNLKSNLKKEKGNLKTILNEEYGWFKKDSAPRQDNSSKPRFRIIFPETDSSATVKDTVAAGKDRKNNRIFKKKFNLAPQN